MARLERTVKLIFLGLLEDALLSGGGIKEGVGGGDGDPVVFFGAHVEV